MSRIFKIAILLFFFSFTTLSSGMLSAQESGTTAGIAVQSERIDQMESRIVARVNEVREEHELGRLTPSSELNRIARHYAHRMATENFFSHYGPSGDSVADRLKAAGIDYRMVGENIFRSINLDDPAEAAVNKWMQSPGHRENILRAEFSETGLGIWKDENRYTIVQIFRKPPIH